MADNRNREARESLDSRSREELRREAREARERMRHRRKLFIWFLLIIGIVIAGVVLSLTLFFNVSSIQVNGASQYADSEIIKACGVKNGDNLFLINRDKVEEHVQQNLPYTGAVQVKRKLPSTLVLDVEDSTIAAAVHQGTEYYLINADGKVLAVASSEKEFKSQIKEQDEKRKEAKKREKEEAKAEAAKTAKTEKTKKAEKTKKTETTTKKAESPKSATKAETGGETSSNRPKASDEEEETTTTSTTTASSITAEVSTEKTKSWEGTVAVLTGLKVKSAQPGYPLEIGNAKVLDMYRDIVAGLEEYNIQGITAMDFSNTADIRLIYQDRITLKLGSTEGLDRKMAMAKKILTEQDEISTTQEGVLDLSIAGRGYFSQGDHEPLTTTTTTAAPEETPEGGDTPVTQPDGSGSETGSMTDITAGPTEESTDTTGETSETTTGYGGPGDTGG